jgi:undecaprenyl-diphosphatase
MNNSIFYFFNNFLFQHNWLDALIWFFAVPFIYIVIAGIFIFFIFDSQVFRGGNVLAVIRTQWKKVFLVFFSGGLAWGLATVVKILVHTDRPFVMLSNANSLFYESGYAFPSGHSATIAALSLSVFFINKRVGLVCMIAALLIGLARISAGVHFPIDILGGYALGSLVAYLLKSR